MNKTIIININGVVFHIEEDAYEVLKNYMTEVKRHFAYSTDSYEIVSDIENRIAEMFTERLAEAKRQAIILTDVQEVTAQMGSVNDFDLEGESIAENEMIERKLFRDPDDRILGGVCSGIAHYFAIEAKWIRLISILIVLLGGSGLFIYLLLWIIVPVARTRADKMAMKGEAINLQNFKRNFDEELESLKHNLSRLHNEAMPGINKAGNFIGELIGHIGKFLGKAVKVIVKVVGGFIIFVGVIVLLAFATGFIVLLGFGESANLNFPMNIINPEYQSPIYFSLFVLVAIPLIALISFAIRALFNKKIITRTGSFALLLIWLTGLGSGIYYGTKLAVQFTDEASFSETEDLKTSPVYYLRLNDVRFLTKEDSSELNISENSHGIIINGTNGEIRMPDAISLQIERADLEKPSLTKIFSAKGPDFETALQTAKTIDYKLVHPDSTILLHGNIFTRNQLWRNQKVKLILRVPLNTRLVFDTRLNFLLENYNLWDCVPQNAPEGMLSEWVMKETGLQCKTDSLVQRKL